MRSILLILFGCLFNFTLSAQFNAKVGYQYGYFGLGTEVHNEIIDQLNTNNNNTLENYQEMDRIKGFHGIVLGARYRFEPVALNLEVSSMFQRLDNEGIEPVSESTLFKDHYYSVVSYSAGLEFFIKKISFGGTLDMNRLRIRAENDVRPDRHIILKENNISSHFFIGINLDGNDHLSLALQPYIQIPWTKFDLTGLESQLDTGADVDKYEDGFMNFGLRVIFQNGYYD